MKLKLGAVAVAEADTVGGGRRQGSLRLRFAIKLVGSVVCVAFVSCASTETKASPAKQQSSQNHQRTTKRSNIQPKITIFCDLLRSQKFTRISFGVVKLCERNIEQERTTSRLLLCPFVQYLIGKVFEVLFMRVFQWFFAYST